MLRVKTIETRKNNKGVYFTKCKMEELKQNIKFFGCGDWVAIDTVYIYSNKNNIKLNRLYSINNNDIKNVGNKKIISVKNIELEQNYIVYRSKKYINKQVLNNIYKCKKEIEYFNKGNITTYSINSSKIAEFYEGRKKSYQIYENYNKYFKKFIPEFSVEVDNFLNNNNVERLLDNEIDEEIVFL